MSRHWWKSRWRSRREYVAAFFGTWRDPRVVALVFIVFLLVVWYLRGGEPFVR